MTLMLGKKDAEPEKHLLKLSNYIATDKLPTTPNSFGWDYLVKTWPMLLNGGDPEVINGVTIPPVGDCADAAAWHIEQVIAASGRRTLNFNDACCIKTYSDVTGYDPTKTEPDGSNPTDQGTAVADLMKYWQETGLIDADNQPHKIDLALSLEPGDLTQLAAGTWIFGAALLGYQLPAFAQTDFDEGKPWTPQRANSKIIGGHAVPMVGRTNGSDGYWHGVTWGAGQQITDAFVQKFCDEAWIPVSEEMISSAGQNLDNFDWQQCLDDAKQIASESAVAA